MNLDGLRMITRRQLDEGFWIRWPDGRQVRFRYIIVREVDRDHFEVKEPAIGTSLVFHALRFKDCR